jgi:hypothetical protein
VLKALRRVVKRLKPPVGEDGLPAGEGSIEAETTNGLPSLLLRVKGLTSAITLLGDWESSSGTVERGTFGVDNVAEEDEEDGAERSHLLGRMSRLLKPGCLLLLGTAADDRSSDVWDCMRLEREQLRRQILRYWIIQPIKLLGFVVHDPVRQTLRGAQLHVTILAVTSPKMRGIGQEGVCMKYEADRWESTYRWGNENRMLSSGIDSAYMRGCRYLEPVAGSVGSCWVAQLAACEHGGHMVGRYCRARLNRCRRHWKTYFRAFATAILQTTLCGL